MELTPSIERNSGSHVLRNGLKRIGASALRRTGVLSAVDRIGHQNLTIITLHRVVTDDERARSVNKPMMITVGQFEQLLDAVLRYGHPVSLGDAVARMAAGEELAPGTVAFTFDDGYRDLYTRAYPLLKSRGIPATVFLTTAAIDLARNYLWWDEVDWFASTCAHRVGELGKPQSADVAEVLERIRRLSNERTAGAEASLREALYRLTTAQRTELVEAMRVLARRDGERPRLMLVWDEVRAMTDLVEPANHTVDHPLLDRLEAGEIRRQILAARTRIEERTGVRCRGFAYPSGVFTEQVMAVAAECGVEYAVTTRFHNSSANTNPLALGRKDAGYLFIDGRIVPDYFKVMLSGVSDWYRREYTWTGSGEMPAARRGIPARAPAFEDTGAARDVRPLIVHVVHSLAVGGLENGLVNLINHLPRDRYRHAVICLTDYTDFRNRIRNPDVEVFALHKRPGKDFPVFVRLWKLLRRLRPDIVHTRNLSTLEAQLPAFLSGVPHRVHGEHGRDADDVDGTRRKYQLLRKLFKPFVHQYVALSHDLERYLRRRVGVPERRLVVLCNGVDTGKFSPGRSGTRDRLRLDFLGRDVVVVGTIGRMEAVKDQITLVRAFVRLVQGGAGRYDHVRLVAIGDGALRAPAQRLLEEAGMTDAAWLPGERDDVPELLRAMDIFVLPSLAEGISNTILEAMASGLPVVATDVGGNSELVAAGKTGILVPRADPDAMAEAIRRYVDDPSLRREDGARGRKRCETEFSIDAMVERYATLYDSLLETKRSGAHPSRVVDAG